MKRIPIAAAKAFAKQHRLKQVVIMAWDGAQMHVVTYGGSIVNSAQAAAGGNFLKKALGFPDGACHAVPAKVVRAGARMQRQAAKIQVVGKSRPTRIYTLGDYLKALDIHPTDVG
jgi:hypothetical protein